MKRGIFFGAALLLLGIGAGARDIQGNLVLEESQQLTLDNETLRVQGHVLLKGNSSLVLRNNASLIIVQVYHEEFEIKLYDRALLIVENSSLDASFDMTLVQLFGNSKLVARKARIDHEIVLRDGATLEVTDSRILGFAAEPMAWKFEPGWGRASAHAERTTIHEVTLGLNGSCRAVVGGARSGAVASFALDDSTIEAGNLPYKVVFKDCTIESIDFSVGQNAHVSFRRCELHRVMVFHGASVSIEDSTVQELGVQLEGLDVAFGGLKVGYYNQWTLQATRGRLPCTMSIRNSTVARGWYLRLREGSYTISDSIIARLRGEFGTADASYRLVGCCVTEWMPWWDHGTVTLENCVLGVIQTPEGATPTLKGNFCVLDPVVSEFWGPWRNNSTITREFPVLVRSADGRPAPNVAVELRDARGQLLQTRYTDQNGQAFVTIAFNERNYRDAWALRVPQFRWEQSISLTSSTPILFPVVSPPCPDLPCREQLRVGPAGMSPASSPLKTGEPFLDWNETYVLSRPSQTIAEDAALDIVALSAMIHETFLYLRMELRGSPADVPSQSATYNFYLSCREWEWGEVRHYHISVGHGELWTVVKTGAGQYKVVESLPVECRVTSRAIEVAIPRSLVSGITLLDVRAETRASSDKTVDFIQGFLQMPGQS